MVDDVATKCAVSPRARMMLSVDLMDPATVLIVYPAFTIRIALPDSDELAITKKSPGDTEAASVMSIVVAAIQKDYGIKVTPQQVESHDPTKVSGKGLAKKWVDLFNHTRDRFLNEISDIPIANKAYRLRVLQRMSTTAEGIKNLGMTAQLLEQAAKEVGDAYSNKQKVELTGKDGGPLNQVTYTAEDYAKAQQKLEGRLEGLD